MSCLRDSSAARLVSMRRTARILVVDDEPLIQRLLARALGEEGYEVECSPDGRAALEWASDAHPPFDLVITNSRMPIMHGDELARRLRERFPDLPIIHISGSGGGPLRPDFPTNIPIVRKPFYPEDLVMEVRRLLAKPEDEREA